MSWQIVFLCCCLTPVLTVPMIVYEMAKFDPAGEMDFLSIVDLVATVNDCACQCYENALCVTGTYFASNQICFLYNAQLAEGKVRITNDVSTMVFNFPEKNKKSSKDLNVIPSQLFSRS